MKYFSLAVFSFAFIFASGAIADETPEISGFQKRALALIKIKESASSYEEWINRHESPEEWIASVQQQRNRVAIDNLCTALRGLSSEHLVHFEEAVKTLPCANEIQSRVLAYFDQARLAFKVNKSAGLLPSLEKHIDPSTGPYYTRGELKAGEIALTFDDGPHPTRTQEILKILNDYGVRATFFELGANAHLYPAISKQAAEEGHSVASHTWDHPELTKLSLPAAEKQFDSGRDAVRDATGIDIPFFRFPYGSKSPALLQMMKSKQIASFFWTMDTRDWGTPNPELLYQNVIKELDRENGGIILFHDIHQQTVIVLPRVLEELRLRNFTTYVFIPH